MRVLLSDFMQFDRKNRLIYGITAAITLIAFLGTIVDLLSGRYAQSFVQGIIVIIALLLLIYYHMSRNYTVFIYSGIVTATVGYNLLLYLDHFVLHSYLILMIIPLVIFFLLPLKQALVVSVIYYFGTAVFSYYAYSVLHVDSAMFTSEAVQVYLFGGFFIVLFGIFYQLAIEESYRKLEHTNAQKELLLKEIHHRIKNNLNKMSSALGLQILRLHRGYADEPEEILRKNKLRIEAMSLVHEALYRSDDINNVEVEAYIKKLITLIERAYGCTYAVEIYSEIVSLPLEKILRLGSILNELYTNSIKHTCNDENIHITIKFIKTNDGCELIYLQSGHLNNIDPKELQKSHGLGMMLVKLSAEEMGGQLTVESREGNLQFIILLPC